MKENKDKKLNMWMRIIFVLYGFLMLYFLFFADAMGRLSGDTSSYGYNVVLFREIRRYVENWERIGLWTVWINLGGNVLGFVPLGFLLPFLKNKYRIFICTVLTCFFVSLGVELLQLVFRVGCFDVDDLFLNVVGGTIGYLIIMIGSLHRRKKNDPKKETKKL